MSQLQAKPLAGGVASGLIASVCCGGSLIFASVGLGTFFGALGLWRYVPQVLAAGSLFIVAINYFFYRRAAERTQSVAALDIPNLRQGMFVSAALGLAAMAGSFVFLEWFNHAVVNPHRFLARPEYSQAIIPGVPNIRLIYAIASFSALALLWALPFPNFVPEVSGTTAALRVVLRVGVFSAAVVVLVALIVNATRSGGAAGHGASQPGQHSPGYTAEQQPAPHGSRH